MTSASNRRTNRRVEEIPMSSDEMRGGSDFGGGGSSASYSKEWNNLFHSMDVDNDGYIPLSELKIRVEAAGERAGLTREQRQKLLEGVDQNYDHQVDFTEFCFMMTKAKQMRLGTAALRAAQVVVPKSLRDETFNYLKEYNCLPPPIFLVIITIVEIAFYVYYVVNDPNNTGVSISGPVPAGSPLIYNPCRRREAWRYVSYMFIHIGIYHIVFNSIAQLAIGIPLELVHKFWRVGIVYVLGVLAGSLAVSVTDPRVFLAGASGGVYALIAAHVANLVVNWSEMEFAVVRLIFLIVLLASDIGVALYNRYGAHTTTGNTVSYVAHIGGFVAGLLMGIVVLRNFKLKVWERVVWWIALVGFLLLLALCILWNIFYPQYCDGPPNNPPIACSCSRY